MEKNFVKVQSTKDIIISISLIVIGAALALLPLGGATNVTGICVAITGVILLFLLKNGYKERDRRTLCQERTILPHQHEK